MAQILLYDRVLETTTTTGTGTLTLAGARTGFQSFSVVGNGNKCYYSIKHQTLAEWEVGIGTYTSSGTTLSRDDVLASSNSGAAVNFSSGTKDVFVTAPAALLGPRNLSAGGRLTLTSATPVTTSDVSAATVVYYTPHSSNRISLYDGTAWKQYQFSEMSLTISSAIAVAASKTGNLTNANPVVTNIGSTTGLYAGQLVTATHLSNNTFILTVDSSTQVTLTRNATATATGETLSYYHTNQDVYCYDNAGTLTIALADWTNNTTRPALAQTDGVWTMNGATTHRYLGTIRLTSNFTTEDSYAKRLVWNVENQVPRPLYKPDITSSWTYATNSWHYANAQSLNRLEFVLGLASVAVDAHVLTTCDVASGVQYAPGIGLDTSTANNATMSSVSYTNSASTVRDTPTADYTGFPGLGWHYLAWIERAPTGAGNATAYGFVNDYINSGIQGTLLA